MMKPKMKEKWVIALESKEYKQARGQLSELSKDGTKRSYCCLGVLAEACGLGHWGGLKDEENPEFFYFNKKSGGFMEVEMNELPDLVIRKLGITPEEQAELIELNDDKKASFKTIAKWIRKNL